SHPSKRRMVDDTDKRIETLFDTLGSGGVPPSILASAYSIVKGRRPSRLTLGIEARDFGGAKLACTNLMAAHQETQYWVLGIKRLVELFETL
ncbi:hypothetical protein HDU91_003366, partial [Kappamyces sp. JEL0680]